MDSAAQLPTTESGRVTLAARLRSLVRRSEFGLIGVAVIVGIIAGICVALIHWAVNFLHHLLFAVPYDGSLSALDRLNTPLMALVPLFGGLVLGLTGVAIRKWRPRRPVDPIEANALQGGRMSLVDSLLIAGQTALSSGVGGSVGLEAGFTQIGSGFASVIGRALKLRRSDMRTLVGCGAAGAIAGAFGAPLTGAFYAFELIVGTYTPFSLAPIMAASISAVMTIQFLGIHESLQGHLASITVTQSDYAALFILALFCSMVGIAIMRGVTFVEFLFKQSRLPVFLQPAIGGAVLGALALVTPRVLSSGYGALPDVYAIASTSVGWLALVVLLKSIASAVSIGSGFRGGLFFASLFLGAMLGKVFAILVPMLVPSITPDTSVYATLGMAAFAVAIIGGPLTMSFLALETTGDLQLVIMVLIASAIVSVTVRQVFGYSFTTWRLHLRGESIRSAQDVGWMRALTVARLMKTDVKAVPLTEKIGAFMEAFPLGSTTWVVAKDGGGRYAGLVSVADVHFSITNGEDSQSPIENLLRYKDDVLLPQMNIKSAADLFERSESDVLAVIDDPLHRRVIGMLTEAHVLRRYTEELEKARGELTGEKWQGEA
ncbi:MAG TPA: chloride channel protein [Methylovirgula sp.]|nr:chloride channel protein [Methylovirgula sp.]